MTGSKEKICGNCRFGRLLYTTTSTQVREMSIGIYIKNRNFLVYRDMDWKTHRIPLTKDLQDNVHMCGKVGTYEGVYRCCPKLGRQHCRIVNKDEPCVNKRSFKPKFV